MLTGCAKRETDIVASFLPAQSPCAIRELLEYLCDIKCVHCIRVPCQQRNCIGPFDVLKDNNDGE
jgi:hypothetical protein